MMWLLNFCLDCVVVRWWCLCGFGLRGPLALNLNVWCTGVVRGVSVSVFRWLLVFTPFDKFASCWFGKTMFVHS